MTTDLELAYAAGVVDSDGTIGIKRDTYAMRVRKDAGQPIYYERMAVKQVETAAVNLLFSIFAGHLGMTKSQLKNGRPLHVWAIHNKAAGRAIAQLLPFLRIKKAQAQNALALRSLVGQGRRWEVPDIIPGEPMVTATEFSKIVGTNPLSVMQACRQGSVPSLRVGRNRMVPVSYIQAYKNRLASGGHAPRSSKITEQMEALYQRAKALNKVGLRQT
jgi:hypothetical protein